MGEMKGDSSVSRDDTQTPWRRISQPPFQYSVAKDGRRMNGTRETYFSTKARRGGNDDTPWLRTQCRRNRRCWSRWLRCSHTCHPTKININSGKWGGGTYRMSTKRTTALLNVLCRWYSRISGRSVISQLQHTGKLIVRSHLQGKHAQSRDGDVCSRKNGREREKSRTYS